MTTLTPTADEMLDLIERECLMVNVNDNSREVAVYSDQLHLKGSSVRGVLTQAYREMNKDT
jgi:hypothetical protein